MMSPNRIDDHLRAHENDPTYTTVKETFANPPHVKRPRVFLNYFDKKAPTLQPGTPLKDLTTFHEEFTALLEGVVFAYTSYTKHPTDSPYPDAVTHTYKKLRGVDHPDDDYRGIIRHLRDIEEAIIIANEHIPHITPPLQEWDPHLFDENDVTAYVAGAWALHDQPGATRQDTIDNVLTDVTAEYHAEMREDDLEPYLRRAGYDEQALKQD